MLGFDTAVGFFDPRRFDAGNGTPLLRRDLPLKLSPVSLSLVTNELSKLLVEDERVLGRAKLLRRYDIDFCKVGRGLEDVSLLMM